MGKLEPRKAGVEFLQERRLHLCAGWECELFAVPAENGFAEERVRWIE